jgi:hypothetical protein
VTGVSGQDFLMGAALLSAAVLALAVAMVVSAAIIHHGLTA